MLAESREPPGWRPTAEESASIDDNPGARLRKTGAGSSFEEETHTRAISAHGALILMSTPVSRGERLTLSNIQTKAALECVVATRQRKGEHHKREWSSRYQSYVLARGLSAKRLDAPSPRCEIREKKDESR